MDQSLINIIINRISVLKDKESAALRREIDRLKSDAASRGFPSMPGHTQDQIKELYERCHSNLPLLIIQEMRDVLLKTKASPSQELSRELKDLLSSYALSANGLKDSLRYEGISSALADTVMISQPNRFFPEIDLIMSELEILEKGDQVTTIYNINSSGGIVQTGDGSEAKIFNINNSDRDEILKILDLMANTLAIADDFKSHKKEEVKEILEEVKNEIGKYSPNRMRLTSLLYGFAMTVQSIASVKPAYEALKATALHIGINLP